MINFCRFIFILVTLGASFALTGCERQKSIQGYLEGEYTNLAVNYPGNLKQLAVTRGDQVKTGQLLFVLDPEPESSQWVQAKAQLQQEEKKLRDLETGGRQTILQAIRAQIAQAQANLTLSTENVKRYNQLFQQGAVSKLTLDQAKADYERDQSLVKQYQANLAEAELGARLDVINEQKAAVDAAAASVRSFAWQLAQKTVRAPVDAQVFDTYYKVGEFVNLQQPVVSLLSPHDVKLIFYIPEPERATLKVGQTVFFSCDRCQKRMSAKIYYISPEAEYTPPVIFSRESREKLVYRIEARLPRETAVTLYPGQPVDVYVH